MSCAGYRNFKRFHQYRVGGVWALQLIVKNQFYRIFTNIIQPIAAIDYSLSSLAQFQQEDEDKVPQYTIEILQLPFSHFALKQMRSIQAAHRNSFLNKVRNPFAYQEGLQSLNNDNQQDQGAFSDLQSKNKGFVHSIQLIQNPMAMDDFCLNDVKTVLSEYDIQDCDSFLSESVIMSDIDFDEATSDAASITE